ncbi:MAG: outer membrane beta-barrel protein [Bacteroidales bacterium]|nr:outer membrane beta-barrel protein [Bacteroidales bacterium]
MLGQGQTGNLGHFDQRLFHFGIQVGYTQSKFELHFSEDAALRESLQGTTSYYAPGFHIAVVCPDLRLNNWINLRFLPGVTLITREVSYSWEKSYFAAHRLAERSRNVESVYGDIPIELKFRSVRYGDFRPYLTAGASYGFDFASLRKNRNQTNQSIIRLQPSDLRYTMGVGFDVFLRYVKFAIELKMNFGLLDLKVDDPDVYIQSFNDLRTRTFMLSFTFEG